MIVDQEPDKCYRDPAFRQWNPLLILFQQESQNQQCKPPKTLIQRSPLSGLQSDFSDKTIPALDPLRRSKMSDIQRGSYSGPGTDEALSGRWSRTGDNTYVPADGEPAGDMKKSQPWKAHWPPQAFGEGTNEKAGETFMRCHQGAAEGRPVWRESVDASQGVNGENGAA